MIVNESKHFKRRRKKLHANEKTELDNAVRAIIENPTIGEQKVGNLADTRVHKFKAGVQEYLLAYRLNEDETEIYLREFGTHENFYRDLKKQ